MEKSEKEVRSQDKRPPEQTEAWILGSGTASLVSAIYLIKYAKLQPHKVHILESRDSVQEVVHHKGNSTSGYDQFARCLPIPIGDPFKDILASVPSFVPAKSGPRQSFLRQIQSAEATRISAAKKKGRMRILIQENGTMRNIATGPLDLSVKHRLNLVRLILKGEDRLGRSQIKDFFPESFFETSFWAVWSAQFGLQPWHSATEFKRALRQYFGDFHSLSILDCLDISGHYQYESIYLPIFLFLQSQNTDFQFDSKVTGIVTIPDHDDKQIISRLEMIQNGFQTHRDLGPHDIVIASIGSSVSGTAIGSNDEPPVTSSFDAYEDLDENWSIWLALSSKDREFGNPYSFSSRRSQSMLESFTITTEDLEFFNYLSSMARSTSPTGAIMVLRESRWKLNLCIPAQPVFQQQPETVFVLWGFALFPEAIGNYIEKSMLECSGAEIMVELVKHLKLPTKMPFQRTVTVPRVMPRMSSAFLAHSRDERPEPIPRSISNIGLVGQFVEIPNYSCVDMSYGVRTARTVLTQLMGVDIPLVKTRMSRTSIMLQMLLWK